MSEKKEVKKITYYENINPFQKPWRCHIYTKDGSHYEGEGYSKDQAKDNAMDVLNANR